MAARLKQDEFEIETTCVICKVAKVVVVPKEGYKAWIHGTSIQKAMPTVSTEDRELLISNICGNCFDNLFSDHED